MANNNWPHGFKPLMVDLAGAPVGVNEYAKPASDTNAIFTYDMLRKVATSQNVESQLIPEAGCQTFSTGTPGTTLILGNSLNYGAPNAATWHTVIDDEKALYEAQCDGTTPITVASVAGKRALINKTAQSNGLRQSAMQVNSSSISGAAGTYDLILRDLYRALNNAEGANAIVEVMVANSVYGAGSNPANE